jgi:hypothetical protein
VREAGGFANGVSGDPAIPANDVIPILAPLPSARRYVRTSLLVRNKSLEHLDWWNTMISQIETLSNVAPHG